MELPDLDYVVLTHDHYDHLEYATIDYLLNKKVVFIVPLGVDARLRGWGVPENKIQVMGWGDSVQCKRMEIIALPAVHYSSRSSYDRNKTLWVSYVFTGGGKKIYWSGDSAYGAHFAEAGNQYGPFDIACVEIDGWNPRWPKVHLFPEEVIQVCKDVKAGLLLPIHWGVFDLAMHPWDESIQKIVDLAHKDSIEVTTPMMGEKIIPGVTPTEYWWVSEQPVHPYPLQLLHTAPYIACCDGAADEYIRRGNVPHLIIGDGDSISEENRLCFADRILTISEQNSNDQTKAVTHLIHQGFKNIVIVGATGKREDHTLGNISLLMEYMSLARVQMATDYGIFTPTQDTTTFATYSGQQVSIFNFGASGIQGENLVYPLSDFTNWWQGSLNEATCNRITIHAKGHYLIFRSFKQ